MLVVALLFQAAGPTLVRPLAQGCGPRDAEEVVVCARRGESPYRLKPLPPRPDRAPSDPLAFDLPGGGTGRVQAVQSRNPTATGHGLGATFNIPLGKGRKHQP